MQSSADTGTRTSSFCVLSRSATYQVVGVDIVDSRKGSLVLDTNVAMLSLVTCYPFDALEAGGPLRYVVTARMLF